MYTLFVLVYAIVFQVLPSAGRLLGQQWAGLYHHREQRPRPIQVALVHLHWVVHAV